MQNLRLCVIFTALMIIHGSFLAAQPPYPKLLSSQNERPPAFGEPDTKAAPETSQNKYEFAKKYPDYTKHDDTFFAVMRTHPDAYARTNLIARLPDGLPPEDSYHARVMPHLRALLVDTNERVANAASKYIGNLNAAPEVLVQALPEIVQQLNRKDNYNVNNADENCLKAVERMGPLAKPAIEHLTWVAQNRGSRVGQQAAVALGAMGLEDKSTVELLLEIIESKRPMQVRAGAFGGLALMGREDTIWQALESEDGEQRTAAVMGASKLPKHGEQLVQRLKQIVDGDGDDNFRQSACKALASIRPMTPDVETAVAEGLRDPSIGSKAAEIVRQMGKFSVPVLAALKHELLNPENRRPGQYVLATATYPEGRAALFEYLKVVTSSNRQWPNDDELHFKLADAYFKIAQDPRRSSLDRVTAVRGLFMVRYQQKQLSQAQQDRIKTLSDDLFKDEENPPDVRLSALLFRDNDYLPDDGMSRTQMREFLVERLRKCKISHLREVCIPRVLSGRNPLQEDSDFSEYQDAMQELIKIATNPRDPLAELAMHSAKQIPSLAASMVPALVQKFDRFSHRGSILVVLGEVPSHPELSVPLLKEEFFSNNRKEYTVSRQVVLIAMAKVIGGHDLDAKPVIVGFEEMIKDSNWNPANTATQISKALGAKAKPIAPLLIDRLKKKQDRNRYDVRGVSSALAEIGPSAVDQARQLISYKDLFQGREAGTFLQSLAKAGLGKEIVPLAVELLDDPQTRNGALEALSIAGPVASDCVPKLIKLLDDENASFGAAHTLARMGVEGKKAGGKLKSLALKGDHFAARALMCLFHDDPASIRVAFRAIRTIDSSAIELARECLTDDQYQKWKTLAVAIQDKVPLADLDKPAANMDLAPSVKKLSDTSFQLEPVGIIGVPAKGFSWEVKSEKPLVFQCKNEMGKVKMVLRVLPPEIDFMIERLDSLQKHQDQVVKRLRAAGASFPGEQYDRADTTNYSDDRMPVARAYYLDFVTDDTPSKYFAVQFYRMRNSYMIEAAVAKEELESVLDVARQMKLQCDSSKQ